MEDTGYVIAGIHILPWQVINDRIKGEQFSGLNCFVLCSKDTMLAQESHVNLDRIRSKNTG